MKYRSGLEKRVAAHLKKKKVKFDYEKDKFKYILEKTYKTDFTLTKKNGEKMYIETKGRFLPSDRTKMRKVKELNPNLDIRFIFQQDNYLTKSKKSRYSDWADKNGFPYHIGEEIPKKWLTELR